MFFPVPQQKNGVRMIRRPSSIAPDRYLVRAFALGVVMAVEVLCQAVLYERASDVYRVPRSLSALWMTCWSAIINGGRIEHEQLSPHDSVPTKPIVILIRRSTHFLVSGFLRRAREMRRTRRIWRFLGRCDSRILGFLRADIFLDILARTSKF